MTKETTLLFERFKSGDLIVDMGGHNGCQKGDVKYDPKEDHFWGFFFYIIDDSSFWFILPRTPSGSGKNLSRDDAKKLLVWGFDGFRKLMGFEETEISIAHHHCSECAQRYAVKFDGKRLFLDSECEFPGGIQPWDLEIDVPSGKLVFRNDMRDLFPDVSRGGDDGDRGFISVNQTVGIKLVEEHHAQNGMFHCFVGNTSPGIYKMPDGRVIVGKLEDSETDTIRQGYDGAEKVGFICTDLWWFSACDYDDFVKRAGEEPSQVGWVPDVVVELGGGPGRYRLRSFGGTMDCHEGGEFAVIQKV